VPGLRPKAAERPADSARADDSDFHFSGFGACGARGERQAAQRERCRGSLENAAAFIHGVACFHRESPVSHARKPAWPGVGHIRYAGDWLQGNAGPEIPLHE